MMHLKSIILRRIILIKYLSYILSSTLFLAILGLGFYKISISSNLWNNSIINFDILIIGIYLLWMIYEIFVSNNDVKQKTFRSDYGTQLLYGSSHALTILSALWFQPIWTKFGLYHIFGFIIFIFGISFRIWAIRTLGQYYSHAVRKVEGHKIIESGLYKYIRHPAYSGMLVAHVGLTIFYFNYITLAILLFLLLPSIVFRIIIEEKTLYGIDGYQEFAVNKKRILPYIW